MLHERWQFEKCVRKSLHERQWPLLAYGIVIYAMSAAPMGAVSALRETSVLFAAVIGYLFLGETLTVRKILACVVIAIGTIMIG